MNKASSLAVTVAACIRCIHTTFFLFSAITLAEIQVLPKPT